MVRDRRSYQEDSLRVIDYFTRRGAREYNDIVSDFQKDFGWEPEYTSSLIAKLLKEDVLKPNLTITSHKTT